jgi:hypothetical protein
MSDLSLQPREVWKQPDRLPAEGRLGSSKHKQAAALSIFVACLALFAYVPLVRHSEPSISCILNCVKGHSAVETGVFRGNGAAEAPLGFQAGWSDCMYFSFSTTPTGAN